MNNWTKKTEELRELRDHFTSKFNRAQNFEEARVCDVAGDVYNVMASITDRLAEIDNWQPGAIPNQLQDLLIIPTVDDQKSVTTGGNFQPPVDPPTVKFPSPDEIPEESFPEWRQNLSQKHKPDGKRCVRTVGAGNGEYVVGIKPDAVQILQWIDEGSRITCSTLSIQDVRRLLKLMEEEAAK